jgi:hypothetical protein
MLSHQKIVFGCPAHPPSNQPYQPRYFSFAKPKLFANPVAHPGSQSAFSVIGGYILPPRSVFGVHVQRSLSGIPSMTCGTCLPHPHQEEREQLGQVPRMHISTILVSEENTG